MTFTTLKVKEVDKQRLCANTAGGYVQRLRLACLRCESGSVVLVSLFSVVCFEASEIAACRRRSVAPPSSLGGRLMATWRRGSDTRFVGHSCKHSSGPCAIVVCTRCIKHTYAPK